MSRRKSDNFIIISSTQKKLIFSQSYKQNEKSVNETIYIYYFLQQKNIILAGWEKRSFIHIINVKYRTFKWNVG